MKKLLVLLLVIVQLRGTAQQGMPVTDSTPAMLDGIKAGYTITETSEKEVGNKGNFSRYKLRFYVTNVTNETKIFYQKPTFFGGSISNVIVRFMCANATGARLTNKDATMQMQPAYIMADVEGDDCKTGKKAIHRQSVNIGYWLRPGETVTVNTIMITPLGEKPAMTAVYYPQTGGQAGTLITGTPQPQRAENFVHIKSFATNNYLQLENGPLACTKIDFEWWSAQWQLLPVPGTTYYVIKNRFRNNYITIDKNGNALMTNDAQPASAMWVVEEVGQTGTYTIRNAANNGKLVMQNNLLRVTTSYSSGPSEQWIIEP